MRKHTAMKTRSLRQRRERMRDVLETDALYKAAFGDHVCYTVVIPLYSREVREFERLSTEGWTFNPDTLPEPY